MLDEADDRLRRGNGPLARLVPIVRTGQPATLRARLDLETERDTRVTMIVAIGLLAGANDDTGDTPWLSELLA